MCNNDDGGDISIGICASGGVGAISESAAVAPVGFRAGGARGRLSTQEHSGGLLHGIAASGQRTWTGDRRCSAEMTRGADDQRCCSRCSSVRAVRLEAEQQTAESKRGAGALNRQARGLDLGRSPFEERRQWAARSECPATRTATAGVATRWRTCSWEVIAEGRRPRGVRSSHWSARAGADAR